MSTISVSQKIEFTGTRTTPEDRLILQRNGFVHVTGLEYKDSSDSLGVIGERTASDELGCWGLNNGKFVIVTPGGEIWLRTNSQPQLVEEGLLARFCPKHEGAFVPLSNGETVDCHELLARVANPSHKILMAS